MPTTATKSNVKQTTLPENWKKETTFYSGDDMINAYLQGKKRGKDEYMNDLAKIFKKNLNIATTVSERLHEVALKKKINIKSIHLKADGVYKFTALFIADYNDFIDDKFKKIIREARKSKNELINENFYINFSFSPKSDSISDKTLSTDGYFLKYDKAQ